MSKSEFICITKNIFIWTQRKEWRHRY